MNSYTPFNYFTGSKKVVDSNRNLKQRLCQNKKKNKEQDD